MMEPETSLIVETLSDIPTSGMLAAQFVQIWVMQ